jgi:hypothetical protein
VRTEKVRHPCQFVNGTVTKRTAPVATFSHIIGTVHGHWEETMGFFNLIITMCVGLIMLGGAALTYKNRMAEQQMEMEQQTLASAAVMPTKVKSDGRASLPKWDDKNYKGLNYHK